MTACAKSFSGSINTSTTYNIPVTLDRNDYSIIFIYINTGSATYASDTVDISKTVYICNNDNTNMTLATIGISTTNLTYIKVKMNGDAITFTLYNKRSGSSIPVNAHI
jgi:hypothetical protein